MYPYLRFAKVIACAVRKEKKGDTLQLDSTSEVTLSCSVTDIDNFMEMNNGRIFTLFDLGRLDLAIRTGLGKKLIKNKWGLVVAGSSVMYRKRIRWNDKFTIKTRVLGYDKRWIYIEQSMWVQGKPCNTAILRTGVTGKGKALPVDEVLAAMGYEGFDFPKNEYLNAFIEADAKRPWPPQM